MEWDNGEGDYPNVNDCYEENNDTLDESSDDEVFINRNCLVILAMMLKNINKYVDKGLMENDEQKDDARRILLHNLMTSNEVCRSILKFFFRRSTRTINNHFHEVLKSIIGLHAEFIKQPDGSEIPPLIQSSSRFYPYFKDCVGALDGTHIRVKVSDEDAPRYRGRKDWPTTNVLAACSFDLKFTYILSGWEGTASDSRIVKNALSRRDKLLIPHDQQVNGNRVGSTFTSTAYKEMVVICREKTKIPLTKDHLKNRMKTLKTNFNSCYDLFKNASGVQWHAESKRFEAEEEVWKQLIDANPSIKKWRYTSAPHYEKLFELFAYDRANGQGASTAAERNVEIIQEEEQRDDIHVSSEVDLDSSPFVEGLKKRKITSVDAYGNKKSSALDLSIKEVVAAIDCSSSVIENKPFRQQKLNEKLYKDLVSVGVPDENILDVYLFLGENKEKMMLVMGCPVEKRLALLKKMFSF
ncbi:hypothetical protein ZIOFF_058388 [Zingiber officinale]|uniref:Transposase n=1 Tax=Zingiber officinale TaxID=94328 RepID=A0A8J5F3Q9_ZINOF|nr:hypothetical protein ZIOFF_058388 [Zingiber officinale]